MPSTKDLVFKKRSVKKLIKRYVRPYKIEEIVSRNTVKLRLPAPMRIYLVVNVNKIERYRKLVREQKIEKLKPVKVNGVEEQEVEKILNKRKV